MAGPRPEAVEEGKARLAAAEEALALARAHLTLHSIRSPIDGVLDSLTCHPGQTVAAGTAIGEIVDSSPAERGGLVAAAIGGRVRVGQTVRLEIGGSAPEPATEPAAIEAAEEPSPRPNAADEPAADEPAADESGASHQRNRRAAAATDATPAARSRARSLRSGGLSIRRPATCRSGCWSKTPTGASRSARRWPVTIVVHRRVEELVVPSTALIDLGEGPLLLVVREGKVVQLHPTSVATHGTWTIISGTDLEPGEPVVVEGGFNLAGRHAGASRDRSSLGCRGRGDEPRRLGRMARRNLRFGGRRAIWLRWPSPILA